MIYHDTIVAPATPYGHGGLAVVRLSGKKAFSILSNISKRKDGFKNRTAVLSRLYNSNNEILDDTIITVFTKPNSYTGEDVVEISCHGNPTIVNAIVEECIKLGARIAEPGEFTRRAFINKKLDLIQAESVASIIHAKTMESVRLNQKIMAGSLTKKLLQIKAQITEALVYIEYELDISEKESNKDTLEFIKKRIYKSEEEMTVLKKSYSEGRLINKGISAVITGPPNAGKSTLLNALLQENRSIVSPQPGTTRDVIDAVIVLDGISVTLVDTAGIRKTYEDIEKDGIEKAKDRINKADFIIEIHDIRHYSPSLENSFSCPSICVLNKWDLVKNNKDYSRETNTRFIVSAKTGFGLNRIKKEIVNSIKLSRQTTDGLFLASHRQYQTTTDCLSALEKTRKLLEEKNPQYELVSLETREALVSLDVLFGRTTPDKILNKIFTRFCVGK